MVRSTAARPVRCGIYTRKSTEEGLEQEFNSLDAQRDACEAFIQSQMHEGWSLVPDTFDDGGFSGGNMERPGLKRLLDEIRAGRIDVIVVYKIDRLTRSLADFAKIVEVLDTSKASFVSVTQAFNTTTSMGRLTLNVLLSFAQFEREVTGERIRDKIAASKRKGLWMGGPVPLGYRVEDRKLRLVDTEATVVRHIYREYLRVGSVPELIEALIRQGVRTKSGALFQRGGLYHLLRNRIYLGEIPHKGASYPGEHHRLIDDTLWNEVQSHLDRRAERRSLAPRATLVSPLTGLLYDASTRRMSPTHASRGNRRYRYYISHGVRASDPIKPTRLSAHLIEKAVSDRLTRFLTTPRELIVAFPHLTDAADFERVIGRGRDFAARIISNPTDVIKSLIERADLAPERLRIVVRVASIDSGAAETFHNLDAELPPARARDSKLVIGEVQKTGALALATDGPLIGLMREAFEARDLVFAGRESVVQVSKRLGRCRKRLTQLARLSFLAPDIVEAIVLGRQPKSVTRDKLLKLTALPPSWPEQRRLLGFT